MRIRELSIGRHSRSLSTSDVSRSRVAIHDSLLNIIGHLTSLFVTDIYSQGTNVTETSTGEEAPATENNPTVCAAPS